MRSLPPAITFFIPINWPRAEPLPVKEVCLFGTDNPNFWVDISENIELKLQAVRCHESQGLTAPRSSGPNQEPRFRSGQAKDNKFGEAFKKLRCEISTKMSFLF